MARSGFSLVEVVVAIGLTSFAFLALAGLLPTGLQTFRQAMDTTVTAQIAERLSGDLQETDYRALLEQAGLPAGSTSAGATTRGTLPRRFFDDQGMEVVAAAESPAAEEHGRIIYEANIRISRGSLGQSPNLITAVIQIASNPQRKELLLNEELLIDGRMGVPFKTYPVLISRSGSWR